MASSTAIAMVFEAAALYAVAYRRLGLKLFILARPRDAAIRGSGA